MYGLETHVLGIPKDNEQPPYLIDKRFEPKKKMTDDHNTCISGVAVLFTNMNEKPQLTIFHDVHADIPLMPETFRTSALRNSPSKKKSWVNSNAGERFIELRLLKYQTKTTLHAHYENS